MRQAALGPAWRVWFGVSLATAFCIGPAWAYVNSSDYFSTQTKYPEQLRSQGWGVCCSWEPEYLQALREKAKRGDEKPDPQDAVNQLVAHALQDRTFKHADKVSAEDKRALAKIAREAIEAGELKEGKIGALNYRVGIYSYEAYWERVDREGRKQKISSTPQARFVAVKYGEK
jgi:hypothetical protein